LRGGCGGHGRRWSRWQRGSRLRRHRRGSSRRHRLRFQLAQPRLERADPALQANGEEKRGRPRGEDEKDRTREEEADEDLWLHAWPFSVRARDKRSGKAADGGRS
jgi:hypothetical protein